MNHLAAPVFQILTNLAVKESSFLESQELRELLHMKCSFREVISSASSSIFLNTPFCNKALISQPVSQSNLVVLQEVYWTPKTNYLV